MKPHPFFCCGSVIPSVSKAPTTKDTMFNFQKSISQKVLNTQIGSSRTINYHPRNIILFKHYPSKIVPDLDYNNTFFFVDNEDFHRQICIRDAVQRDLKHQLRDKMLQQSYNMESFQCEIMASTDGKAVPPHRPIIDDQRDLHLAFWAFLDWAADGLRATGSSMLFPKELIPLIDPIPGINIENLTPYSFPISPSHVYISPDADSVHVTSVESFMYYVEIDVNHKILWRLNREYVQMTLKGETTNYGEYTTYIPRGTVIVIWNSRSMARPSFENAFKTLYDAHKPSLLVITQSR